MKKAVAILLLVAMICTLAACGGKFTCDSCQKEVSGGKNEIEMAGQTATVCDDCYKMFDQGMDALGDLGDQLGDLDLGSLMG